MTGPDQTPAAQGDNGDLWAAVRALRTLTTALVAREETRDHEIGLLADAVRRLAEPDEPPPAAFSWLDGPGTDRNLAQDLDELGLWLHRIYLWYATLPECWLWHPVVIEELTVLMQLWVAAHARGAPVHALGDWHDRYRPRVTERITTYTKRCSGALEWHQQNRPEAAFPPNGDQNDPIANWWAHAWQAAPPAPPAELITRRNNDGHRR